jgi:dolichol-phosphate mannosyltransferase
MVDTMINGTLATPTRPAPLLFVIPAYNEEANIERLFEDLESHTEITGAAARIVIVDDGSADATPRLVEQYGGELPIELLRFERNQGPGAAFRAGFESVLADAPADALVVTMEADTTGDLDALPRMLARASSDADVVLADWRMQNVAAHRKLLSRGRRLRRPQDARARREDVSSFFRVYRASVLQGAFVRYGDDLIREPGFACKAEILANLASMRVRIVEEPVNLDWSRREGESKMPVLRTMLAYWRMLARQRTAAQEPAGL